MRRLVSREILDDLECEANAHVHPIFADILKKHFGKPGKPKVTVDVTCPWCHGDGFDDDRICRLCDGRRTVESTTEIS